jgi:ABC-2 type transport system permease protein
MISTIVRAGYRALRRDRSAFILSFLVPIVFFSIFAVIFGRMGSSSTPRVHVLVADQDHSPVSQRLVQGLQQEPSLEVSTHPKAAKGAPDPPDYTAASAAAAVKQGVAPAAIIIPRGFGANPITFGPAQNRPVFRILDDPSDPIAAQLVAGMLQKVTMMSLPDVWADVGMKYFEKYSGGLTPEQHERVDSWMSKLHALLNQDQKATAKSGESNDIGGMVAYKIQNVVGENNQSPEMIAYYAAAIGVMFLLFSASRAGATLLDEADSGTLDRVLSAQVSMTSLLAGKMTYCTLLAFVQLIIMFLWGAAAFHLDLFSHLPGFLVMSAATSFAIASFGMLLASLSRSRESSQGLATLIILAMSAVGGSMFPRFLMPEFMKQIGLLTFNSWAIDGFVKVFWRNEPVWRLGPQLAVLIGSGVALFFIARRFARKWETA